jgi:hypothetical protein
MFVSLYISFNSAKLTNTENCYQGVWHLTLTTPEDVEEPLEFGYKKSMEEEDEKA